jgi:S-adenosylmethionine synthetase
MDPRKIIISAAPDPILDEQAFELVERKGVGHPDSICDGIVEAVCLRLCREYQQRFGTILHHNIDKSFLVAGQSDPRPGGGRLIQPMRFILGDRAVDKCRGEIIPIAEIAEQTVNNWFRSHLRFVDPGRHLVFQNELKPGSAELIGSFQREKIGANDTSVGVGYAPLSPTEQLVLALEKWLNSAQFKRECPETGEDVKVMACRRGRDLQLIIAVAFVAAFVPSSTDYFTKKAALQSKIEQFIAQQKPPFDAVTVEINALDDLRQGDAGIYLTVLGTSAEGGDSGQVGRGNRVNGVISYNRPSTTEAAAGKNPVSHSGKIYTILSHQLAAKIYTEIAGVREVSLWLCSRIGHPIDQPVLASAAIKTDPGVSIDELRNQVTGLVAAEFANIDRFLARLRLGEFAVY